MNEDFNSAIEHLNILMEESDTSKNFKEKDTDSGEGYLVDKILDKAKQKGTGKWTSQNAMDLGIPVPTIDAAVTMRETSSFKQLREETGL